MYCVYGVPCSSLLIESTDSVIIKLILTLTGESNPGGVKALTALQIMLEPHGALI